MVSEEAKDAIECKPVVEDLDSEPTEEDLKKALVSLPPEKAPARIVFEQKSRNAVKALPSPSSTKSSACAGGRGRTRKHERGKHSHSIRKQRTRRDCHTIKASHASASLESSLLELF